MRTDHTYIVQSPKSSCTETILRCIDETDGVGKIRCNVYLHLSMYDLCSDLNLYIKICAHVNETHKCQIVHLSLKVNRSVSWNRRVWALIYLLPWLFMHVLPVQSRHIVLYHLCTDHAYIVQSPKSSSTETALRRCDETDDVGETRCNYYVHLSMYLLCSDLNLYIKLYIKCTKTTDWRTHAACNHCTTSLRNQISNEVPIHPLGN